VTLQGDNRSKRFFICQRTHGSDMAIAQVKRDSPSASSNKSVM
jgi:hypothetical protein